MANLESTETVPANHVDGARLWSRLMAMAEVAPTDKGGSNRQALSDDDAAGRALLLQWTAAAGCSHEVDEVGNLFVRRPGRNPDAEPVVVGSHLDTQPLGGRFDGVYGVLGGLEVLERLNDLDIETERPIDLVVWTNEEGSRFPPSMMGSAVWAGHMGLDEARASTDVNGITAGEELDRLGWAGTRPAQPVPIAAAFELHIEQGPILEHEELEVGIVTGVQGLRWFTIELEGYPAHAGPTPMVGRKDPARAIGAIIGRVYEMVDGNGPWGRGTFAQFRSHPVSPNTIPERLWCTLDLRHPDLDTLETMEQQMRTIVAEEAERLGVGADVRRENNSPPVAFAPACITSVTEAVQELGYSHQQMISGAGHDACYVASHAPTSMIFIPCDDGLSHNEAENITAEQAERGASVLLGAVLRSAGG